MLLSAQSVPAQWVKRSGRFHWWMLISGYGIGLIPMDWQGEKGD